jgi:hypothetical protein
VVLPLDSCAAHRPALGLLAAGLVAYHAGWQRYFEAEKHTRHPVSAHQPDQGPASVRRERRRIDHAQTIEAEPLLHNEVEQRESLRLKALVLLVITHQRSAVV